MTAAINIEILRKKPRVGGNQYVYHLVRGMNSVLAGDKLILLNNSNKGGRETLPDLPQITNANIKYKNIKISKKLLAAAQSAFGFPRLENIAGGFDVYHEPAHSDLPASTRARKVCTIHDLVPMKKGMVPDTYWEYMKDYFRRAAGWADIIVTDSSYTRDDVVDTLGVDPAKITVVPLAAPEEFKPVRDAALLSTIRSRYGIGREFLFFVGRFEPRKNVVNIIKAFEEFRASEGDSSPLLVLAGETTWATSEVDDAVDNSPFKKDIVKIGYIPEEDLILLMNAALCLVYPSRWEGFGLPILEAMACGTPVITSNVTSNPEVAGGAALLVSPDDVQHLAGHMASVVSDTALREELVRKGFERSASFSWEKCAAGTIAVYRALN